MDVLVPDTAPPGAARLTDELLRRGHTVHTCKEEPDSSACVAVQGGPCPLDDTSIDVALWVGEPVDAQRGDGAACAAVRKVPLVLVDPSSADPLRAVASAITTPQDAVLEIEQVAAGPLQIHTGIAQSAVKAELERMDLKVTDVSVQVRRKAGTLVVELCSCEAVSRAQAEGIATHVVQAVRRHDPWARQLDVVVHPSKH